MSNRINLTQFEGITKGKWQWFTGDGKKGLALFPSVEENDDILLWDESDPLAANQYTANADAIAAVPELIAELKRCYELIDAMNGNVPYVEHCEECGATDGGEAEGCDYCGIIHYQSKPRGFYHKDSPKR